MATILAALLRDAPLEGLGPVRCVALGPAAVLSAELAEAAEPFTVSVILGCAKDGVGVFVLAHSKTTAAGSLGISAGWHGALLEMPCGSKWLLGLC